MKKSILILGGSSDMARAMARQYASLGEDLILTARDISVLEPLKSDLMLRYNVSVNLFTYDCEITSNSSKLYNDICNQTKLLIVCIGYLGDESKAMTDSEELHKILSGNFTGYLPFINLMSIEYKNLGQGGIIGISSVAGDRGRQSNFLYGSAKAGFTAYLSGLRNSLTPHGVHVMTVKPGFVRTKMIAHLETPGVLTAEPDEVARKIIRSFAKKKNIVYIRPIWKWIMLIIRFLPESIFKRLKL